MNRKIAVELWREIWYNIWQGNFILCVAPLGRELRGEFDKIVSRIDWGEQFEPQKQMHLLG